MSELEATGGETTLLTPPEPETTSWFGEENAEYVQQKGWNGGDAAIKSYRELERNASGKVKMPDFSNPEQNAEEIRAFYQKTGCPENPDGYALDIPEGGEDYLDEDTLAVIKKAAWDSGSSQQAVSATVKSVIDSMITRDIKTKEQSEVALKEELGPEYDGSMEVAKRFYEKCSPEFIEFMERTKLGNNPVMIKEFISLGKKTMGDTLIKGEAGNSEEAGYKPAYPDSPEMYAGGEGPESDKARAYFTAKGHKY